MSPFTTESETLEQHALPKKEMISFLGKLVQMLDLCCYGLHLPCRHSATVLWKGMYKDFHDLTHALIEYHQLFHLHVHEKDCAFIGILVQEHVSHCQPAACDCLDFWLVCHVVLDK